MLSAHCSDKFLDNNSDLVIDNFLQAHKAIKIHQVFPQNYNCVSLVLVWAVHRLVQKNNNTNDKTAIMHHALLPKGHPAQSTLTTLPKTLSPLTTLTKVSIFKNSEEIRIEMTLLCSATKHHIT